MFFIAQLRPLPGGGTPAVCMCVCSCGAISTGGSQGLVYRGLETADVLHSGAVRLHGLHVLVEDGKDLIVEDLVLPNAVCHLLQWLLRENGKKRIKMYKSRIIMLDCEGKTRWKQHTHHVLDDLILAVLSLHFEEVIAEVKEVKATLLSQQHDDSAAGPVQPVPKALSVSQGMALTQADSVSPRHKFGKVKSV